MIHLLEYVLNRRCKTEDVNLNEFNRIPKINEGKTLTKHILIDYKSKLDGKKFNSNQKLNKDKCRFEYKNPINHVC